MSQWESIWKVLGRMVIHINIHTQWTLSDDNSKSRGPLTFRSALKGEAARGRSFFPKGLTPKMESHMSSSREQIRSFDRCSLGSMVPTELVPLSAQEEQAACQTMTFAEGGKKSPGPAKRRVGPVSK